MCKKCFELHSKTTKNHILSDNEVTIQLNCSKHSKDNVVYYCGDCKSAFCEKCKKVHNLKHKEHKKHIYDKQNENLSKMMQTIIVKSKEIIRHNENVKEKIINVLKEKNEYKELIAIIEKRYISNNTINTNIVKFLENILDNYIRCTYIPYNYFAFFKNTILAKYKFTDSIDEKNIDSISNCFIEYLSSSYVIRNQMLDLKKIEDSFPFPHDEFAYFHIKNKRFFGMKKFLEDKEPFKMKIIDDGKEILVKEVEIKGKNMISICFVLRNENVLLFNFDDYKGDFICQADSKKDYNIISQYYYKKPKSRFKDEIREIVENPFMDNQIFYISLTTLFIYNAETNHYYILPMKLIAIQCQCLFIIKICILLDFMILQIPIIINIFIHFVIQIRIK